MVSEVRGLRSGAVRINTRFLSTRGHYISLFLAPERIHRLPNSEVWQQFDLTDYGFTLQECEDRGLSYAEGPRAEGIRDITHCLGITKRGPELVVDGVTIAALPEAIFRLGQACSQIATLDVIPGRAGSPRFSSVVRDLFAAHNCSAEQRVLLDGRNGKFEVDFFNRHRRSVLMLVTGSGPRAVARSAAYATACLWDTKVLGHRQFSLINTDAEAPSKLDLSRLSQTSTVVRLDEFADKLVEPFAA